MVEDETAGLGFDLSPLHRRGLVLFGGSVSVAASEHV